VDSLLGIPAGLALSTAAGLRIFVPLMLTSAAARLGYVLWSAWLLIFAAALVRRGARGPTRG
jgi:hypothetical protein